MYNFLHFEVIKMTWKIIADSGCDLREIENLAPNTEYINIMILAIPNIK